MRELGWVILAWIVIMAFGHTTSCATITVNGAATTYCIKDLK